jgi:hypothetical protein
MFRTPVRRKDTVMLSLLVIAALWAGWRTVGAARKSLRGLPRSNDDMVFF